MTTLGRYYEITLGVQGVPDVQTGYLLGIQELDAVVRNILMPAIARCIETDSEQHPAKIMGLLWTLTQSQLDTAVYDICWHLTPYHRIEMTQATRDMNSILLRQQFEFSAAHRLHSSGLTDQENTAFFGKCNNPSGHGHNYKIEPAIRVGIDQFDSAGIQEKIEQAVNSAIIDRLDHKFLNIDCPEFDQALGGRIPSVENIARYCFDHLGPALEPLGCSLEQITVWETERTSATYPA